MPKDTTQVNLTVRSICNKIYCLTIEVIQNVIKYNIYIIITIQLTNYLDIATVIRLSDTIAGSKIHTSHTSDSPTHRFRIRTGIQFREAPLVKPANILTANKSKSPSAAVQLYCYSYLFFYYFIQGRRLQRQVGEPRPRQPLFHNNGRWPMISQVANRGSQAQVKKKYIYINTQNWAVTKIKRRVFENSNITISNSNQSHTHWHTHTLTSRVSFFCSSCIAAKSVLVLVRI